MKRSAALFLSLFAATVAAHHAQAEMLCRATPSLATVNYPGAKRIVPSNNLLLPAGKSIPAEGQKLLVIGRVLDNRCMPVPEAVVEMWQVNPFGQWLLAGPEDRVTPNPAFAGAGRAVTDTDGQFQFVTAFPAGVGKRAPNLNFKIFSDGEHSFSTVLFFAGDERNAADPIYQKLSTVARADVTLRMGKTDDGDLAGTLDIVLPTRAEYRTY